MIRSYDWWTKQFVPPIKGTNDRTVFDFNMLGLSDPDVESLFDQESEEIGIVAHLVQRLG